VDHGSCEFESRHPLVLLEMALDELVGAFESLVSRMPAGSTLSWGPSDDGTMVLLVVEHPEPGPEYEGWGFQVGVPLVNLIHATTVTDVARLWERLIREKRPELLVCEADGESHRESDVQGPRVPEADGAEAPASESCDCFCHSWHH
jgi:hypothetical protein